MQDYDPAIEAFQKALTEHRNPDTLKKLNDAEKAQKQKLQEEYFDPEKAEVERQLGERWPQASEVDWNLERSKSSLPVCHPVTWFHSNVEIVTKIRHACLCPIPMVVRMMESASAADETSEKCVMCSRRSFVT